MIGVIADDVTGATDAASACRDGGLSTALSFGVPMSGATAPGMTFDGRRSDDGSPSAVDVLVIALKTRSLPAQDAVAQCLAAARHLLEAGADLLYFKYCSTFDSTPAGNIGPVLDSFAELVGAGPVVTTPAAPSHGRTVYQGYLFVEGTLLAESHMHDHPLTPMHDSSVPRLLKAQTRRPVSQLTLDELRGASAGSPARPGACAPAETRYVVADAIAEADLDVLARSIRGSRLAAGSAGLIGAVARDRAGAMTADVGGARPPAVARPLPRHAAILAGSCSDATLAQIAEFIRSGRPAFALDPVQTPDPIELARTALDWFDGLDGEQPVLVFSSRPREELARIQSLLGVERSAQLVEQATGHIARGLVERGVGRIVCAGGETSGAAVAALELETGLIGSEAAPGVPWIHFAGDSLALLLKSGNFGDPEVFVRAATQEAS